MCTHPAAEVALELVVLVESKLVALVVVGNSSGKATLGAGRKPDKINHSVLGSPSTIVAFSSWRSYQLR